MIWFISTIAVIAAIIFSVFRVSAGNKRRKKLLESQQWDNQLSDLLNSFKKKA